MAKQATASEVQLLNQKMDLILEELKDQKRRQEGLEELKNDVLPIANHLVNLTIIGTRATRLSHRVQATLRTQQPHSGLALRFDM